MTTKNRGADALARSLARAGVRRLFTLSGNHIMPVFDAALDAGIELLHVRHEAIRTSPDRRQSDLYSAKLALLRKK